MPIRIASSTLGALILAVGLAAPVAAAAAPVGPIAGTWRLAGNPDPTCGVLPFVNLASIGRDGQLVNVDPLVGTGVGELRRVAAADYTARFQGFIVDGASVLTYAVRGTLTLDASDQFSGNFVADINDPAGNLLCSYGGTLSAQRL